MVNLGLKIFYLRTRERRLSQQAVADALGIRQATLSHVERGTSLPSAALMVELCRFYDVTPTYLLDADRGVIPRPTERWSSRDALVTTGMWIEARSEDLRPGADGTVLCPCRPGQRFFDDEAAGGVLRLAPSDTETDGERALVDRLQAELQAHPKRRHRVGGS